MSTVNDDLKRKTTASYLLKAHAAEATRRGGRSRKGTYASEFLRDRDLILGSMALRRLAGKAQVYITGVDDHMRTRLTHTLEVSRIARTIAAPLKLDADLVEAMALGHDLGHTPFGHAGERTLHEIMTPQKDHILGKRCPMHAPADPSAFAQLQGFKHNLQSLVVAMKLERNFEGLGLDLTDLTLYGIQAHSGAAYKRGRVSNPDALGYYDAFLQQGCGDAWSLESLLVAEADEIAQCRHDVEDALIGGLITPAEIVKIIGECFGPFKPFQKLTTAERRLLNHPENYDPGEFLSLIARCLTDLLTSRMIAAAAYHINRMGAEHGLNSHNFRDFRARHRPDDALFGMVFSYSYTPEERDDPNGFAQRVGRFRDVIARRVLSSYDIQKSDARGRNVITGLFRAYYDRPQQLPDSCVYELLSAYHELDGAKYHAPEREKYWKHTEKSLREQARREGVGSVRQLFTELFAHREETLPLEEMLLMRTICNHIACMTDAAAARAYAELYG